jgi:hypothetical protein
MDNLFGESEPDYDWESFMNYSNNNTDNFTANYEDTNFFPPLDLFESTAPDANAEQVNLNAQASSAPAGYSRAADHTQTSVQASPGSQSLEHRIQALTSKVREIKQLYVTQEQLS